MSGMSSAGCKMDSSLIKISDEMRQRRADTDLLS